MRPEMKCPLDESPLIVRKDGRYDCPVCEAIISTEAALP